jgi:hypothetical protein
MEKDNKLDQIHRLFFIKASQGINWLFTHTISAYRHKTYENDQSYDKAGLSGVLWEVY